MKEKLKQICFSEIDPLYRGTFTYLHSWLKFLVWNEWCAIWHIFLVIFLILLLLKFQDLVELPESVLHCINVIKNKSKTAETLFLQDLEDTDVFSEYTEHIHQGELFFWRTIFENQLLQSVALFLRRLKG